LGLDSKREKHAVEYTFKNPNGQVLFSGSDFFVSPLYKPESKKCAIALLGFLTLQSGDTDSDYFDDYTPEQMAFCQSSDCDNLKMYTLE
jgi:hypothetical protein